MTSPKDIYTGEVGIDREAWLAGFSDPETAAKFIGVATSKAYEVGRSVGINQAARVAGPVCPCGESDYDKQAFDLRTSIAESILALHTSLEPIQ